MPQATAAVTDAPKATAVTVAESKSDVVTNPKSQAAKLLRRAEAAREARINIARSVAREKLEAGQELSADDERTIADTFEGENYGDLDTAINDILGLITEDLILIAGIEKVVSGLQARKKSAEGRIEFHKGVIQQAMIRAECVGAGNGIRAPLATVSCAIKPPTVAVDNESEVPAKWFKEPVPPEPTVDKVALNKHVLARYKAEQAAAAIPGEAERAEAFDKIIADYGPPVPGVHVETGGHKLTLTGLSIIKEG